MKSEPLVAQLVSEVYLRICDSETGDYRHFPFEGGAMDQPAWTMSVLDLIKLNYKITMSKRRKEESEKMAAKAKTKKRGLR